MIQDAFISLGAWAWIILGILLIGTELVAPGAFFLWLGLAAIVTGLLDAVLDLSWQVSSLLFAVLCVAAVIVGRAVTRSKAQAEPRAEMLNQRRRSPSATNRSSPST